MNKKANRVLAIIFLIFAIGVLAVGITWSGEVKTSMKDTEQRLAGIQQDIDASADSSAISGSVENYNQNVKVYNSYLDMYDMGFKLIMTLIIADLVVVIILIAVDKADEEESGVAAAKSQTLSDEKRHGQKIQIQNVRKIENIQKPAAEESEPVQPDEEVDEKAAENNKPAVSMEVQPQKTNLGGQSTIELTKQLRNYKNLLAAGKITEKEFQERKEELLKSI